MKEFLFLCKCCRTLQLPWKFAGLYLCITIIFQQWLRFCHNFDIFCRIYINYHHLPSTLNISLVKSYYNPITMLTLQPFHLAHTEDIFYIVWFITTSFWKDITNEHSYVTKIFSEISVSSKEEEKNISCVTVFFYPSYSYLPFL